MDLCWFREVLEVLEGTARYWRVWILEQRWGDVDWVRSWFRHVEVQHFLELDAEVDDVPGVHVGSSCYDCPDGTNDHEGESHE